MESYPLGAALIGQPVEELAEHSFVVEVEPIPGGVLCYDDELFDAVGNHALGFA